MAAGEGDVGENSGDVELIGVFLAGCSGLFIVLMLGTERRFVL